MLNQWWYATQGAINVPTGLILAAKDGITLGPDWSVWTDADGLFLRGTDSDSVVATTGTRTVPSVGSGSGGGHTGSGPHVDGRGWYSYCNTHCYTIVPNTSSVGSHSGHSIPLQYRPAYDQTRLIQAQNDAPVPIGAIMFGDAANAKQLAYAFNARYFRAGTAVATGAESRSASCGSRSDSHNHSRSTGAVSALSITNMYTSINSSGGGSHNHSIASLAVTPNIARCTLRAFDIIDQKNIKGLIGMWAGAGVPDKWELVAELTDRFLLFSNTGDGSVTGSDTISFSGYTGYRGHSHSASGWAYEAGSPNLGHTGTVSHRHSFSRSGAPYLPERYHIKFIRYVG